VARFRPLTVLRLAAMQDNSESLSSRVFPIWHLAEHHRCFRLVGFQVLCAPVIFAHAFLDLEELAGARHGTTTHGEHPAGVIAELLDELAAAYGSREKALTVAASAAADALACCNSWYTAAADGSLQATRSWSEEHVTAYLQSSWCGCVLCSTLAHVLCSTCTHGAACICTGASAQRHSLLANMHMCTDALPACEQTHVHVRLHVLESMSPRVHEPTVALCLQGGAPAMRQGQVFTGCVVLA
jgi:hypothetical protein